MPRAGSRPVALAIALLLTMGLLLSVTPAAAQPGSMCDVITIAELDAIVAQLEEAGLVESYTNEPVTRSTPTRWPPRPRG
jgi:hypothetical protein